MAFDDMAKQVSQNVRFQLLRREVPRENWGRFLRDQAGMERLKVELLLRGRLDDSELQPDELKRLASAVGLPSDYEELLFEDLLGTSGTNICAENVRFLIGSLKKGQKQELASYVNVTPTTISRWARNGSGLAASRLGKFLQFFGLPVDTDLYRSPLFLDAWPVSISQRRAWAIGQLEQLGDQDFQSLYPALKRLLEEK